MRRVPDPGLCLPQKKTPKNPAKAPKQRAGSAPGIARETLAGKGAAERAPGQQACSTPPAPPSHFLYQHLLALQQPINHPQARPCPGPHHRWARAL